MTAVLSLWLPIVVAAVAVFVLSSVLHMVLTYHRSDYRQLPKEAEALAALRAGGVAPGLYQFPWCAGPKEMGTPEMQAKLNQGPVGMMTVMPSGPMAMGKYLGLWFIYVFLVSVVIGWVAGVALAPAAAAETVACVTGGMALLAYSLSHMVESIWRGFPWSVTAKGMLDGIFYAAATAAVFAWLWPA